ncbi:MAG: hypothetical protein EXR66_03885 [Dehalococcoidia bacterium]|nr:hypothetical protein [Dehalococcoidia bacterium]
MTAPSLDAWRGPVVEVGRDLYARGLVSSHGGSLSVRRHAGGALITATGAMLGHLEASTLVAVDESGALVQDGAAAPSCEHGDPPRDLHRAPGGRRGAARPSAVRNRTFVGPRRRRAASRELRRSTHPRVHPDHLGGRTRGARGDCRGAGARADRDRALARHVRDGGRPVAGAELHHHSRGVGADPDHRARRAPLFGGRAAAPRHVARAGA